MGERLVSIRMPSTLARDLKALVEPNHYLDFSEQLRSIIRKKALSYREPANLDRIKHQIEQEIRTKDETQRRQEILRELKKLLLEEVDK